jgi:ribonuclease BN (tRNA processing enzyme)
MASGAAGGTRLILLGTAGGPRPVIPRSSPAQVLLIDDVPYVVDCGEGVAHQLVRAGIPPRTVRHVLLTHHHSDHNLDYGNLLYLAWATGLQTPIQTYGPPPIAAMTGQFLALHDYDLSLRMADEGRPPLAPLVQVHEFAQPGVILDTPRVRVTAALVHHPPVEPSFAYRFDAPDRSIVISGDTTPSPSLVALAQGADVLVHEVMYAPAIPRLLGLTSNAARLRQHLLASHTTLDQVGRIATAAGVRTLVLSHFVPSDDPEVSDAVWRAGAEQHFAGEVIVGHDLLVI